MIGQTCHLRRLCKYFPPYYTSSRLLARISDATTVFQQDPWNLEAMWSASWKDFQFWHRKPKLAIQLHERFFSSEKIEFLGLKCHYFILIFRNAKESLTSINFFSLFSFRSFKRLGLCNINHSFSFTIYWHTFFFLRKLMCRHLFDKKTFQLLIRKWWVQIASINPLSWFQNLSIIEIL